MNATERELVKRALEGWNRLHNMCYATDLGTGNTLCTDDRVYLDLQECLKDYEYWVEFDGNKLLGPYDVEPINENNKIWLVTGSRAFILARLTPLGWRCTPVNPNTYYRSMNIVKVLQE